MALKNKTQLAATIAALAATVDLETDDKPQRSELVESMLCLLDRETTANTATSTTLALDFTNYELIKSTLSASGLTVTYNVSGLSTGEIKFLWISKLGGDTIIFNGVVPLIQDTAYFNSYVGDVLFILIKKSGSGVTYMMPMKLLAAYLSVANNGSDIADAAAFRTNLDVYSTAEAQAALVDTGWLACSRVASQVDSVSFESNIAQYGKMVTCSGKIKLNSDPGSATLFTIPSTIGMSTVDVPFIAGDADGATSEIIELKVAANTRNVVAVDTSLDRVSSYNFSYYVG